VKLMIEARNLTKAYGETKAVDNLTLQVPEGTLCGFIGPNGAGKTTTIRILASLIPPTQGSVHIGGQRLWPYGKRSQITRFIGYVPDQFGVYENMKVWEYLEFFGMAYDLSPEERARTIEDVMALTDLYELNEQFVLSLSRGQQQRLALARVLLHNPALLLLDEPASGLDPQARIELRELLSELQSMGKTVFISSHILTELATICDMLCIIDVGKLVFNGSPSQLREKVQPGRTYRISVAKKLREAAAIVQRSEGVEEVLEADGYFRARLKEPFPGEGFLSAILQKAGFHLTLYQPEDPSLEEAYMKLIDREEDDEPEA